MRKQIFIAFFAATMTAAGADIKLKNDAGEALDLTIKGTSTVQTSIGSNTFREVGGNAAQVTIVVKKGGKEVASGTFNKGDSVKIKKSGQAYHLEKH